MKNNYNIESLESLKIKHFYWAVQEKIILDI